MPYPDATIARADARAIAANVASFPALLPQKTQMRRLIALAVWQLAAPRLPKRERMSHHRARRPERSVPDDGVVRVQRERRRASIVSVVTGLSQGELAETAGELKRLCGTGGTAKNGAVEIQGDHREAIVRWFAARGRKVKLAGG